MTDSDQQRRRFRTAVWRGTIGSAGALLLVTAWVESALTSHLTPSRLLAVGASFVLVQVGLVAAMMVHILVSKTRYGLRMRRREQQLPRLRQDVAAFVVGRRDSRCLHAWHRRSRELLESCLVEFLPQVCGARRDRLVRLVHELGWIRQWQAAYAGGDIVQRLEALAKISLIVSSRGRDLLRRALQDPVPGLRLEAATGLLQDPSPEDVLAVAELAIEDTRWVRAALSDSLKPHAALVVDGLLGSWRQDTDPARLIGALDLVASWEVMVPCSAIGALLHHADAGVMAKALSLLPFVLDRDRYGSEVLGGLLHRDPQVRAAAAAAAGRLQLQSAVEVLSARLRDSDPRVARAAATTLARLGQGGKRLLNAALVQDDRVGATVALEALERERLQRARAVGE